MSHKINMVGGEKGGVGKSMFTKILVSYYLHKGEDFIIYECDSVNRDILRVYEGSGLEVRELVLSQSEKYITLPSRLLNAAQERDLVINLPAGAHKVIGEWFKLAKVKRQTEQLGISMYLWYVCDGDKTNLRLFQDSCNSVPIEHIFVKNMVRYDDEEWEQALMELREQGIEIELDKIPVVVMEKLAYREAKALSQNYLSFEAMQDYEDEDIQIVERNLVRFYLEDCLAELDKVIGGGKIGKGVLKEMTPSELVMKQMLEEVEIEAAPERSRTSWQKDEAPGDSRISRQEAEPEQSRTSWQKDEAPGDSRISWQEAERERSRTSWQEDSERIKPERSRTDGEGGGGGTSSQEGSEGKEG